jgi:hypothetical protein
MSYGWTLVSALAVGLIVGGWPYFRRALGLFPKRRPSRRERHQLRAELDAEIRRLETERDFRMWEAGP